jgi:Tol biopolymer transport system component
MRIRTKVLIGGAILVSLALIIIIFAGFWGANGFKFGKEADVSSITDMNSSKQAGKAAGKGNTDEGNGQDVLPTVKKLYIYEDKNGEKFLSETISDDKSDKLINEIPIEKEYYCESKLSADGKKVAWIEDISDSDDRVVLALYVAGINGKNKVKVVEDTGNEGLTLVSFNNSQELYYGHTFTDIGGLCCYEYIEDLYKLDTRTGKSKLVFGTTKDKRREYDNSDYITAFSNNKRYVAYFQKDALNEEGTAPKITLFIKDLSSDKEMNVALPSYDGLLAYGKGVFSPDDKKIVFQVAIKGSENDSYVIKYVVADFNTLTTKECGETSDKEGNPERVIWTSNDTIDLVYQNTSVKTLTIDK